jgi:hypothetical protein
MNGDAVRAGLKPAIATILFVWLTLNAAGLIGSLILSRATSAWIASAFFVAMLSVYSLWTEWGRRSPMQIFMAAGVALLPLSLALFMLVMAAGPHDLGWLLVGGNVGFFPSAMDSGALLSLIVWWLSIMLLIFLALAPRELFFDIRARE